jgi:hypothetical protein
LAIYTICVRLCDDSNLTGDGVALAALEKETAALVNAARITPRKISAPLPPNTCWHRAPLYNWTVRN